MTKSSSAETVTALLVLLTLHLLTVTPVVAAPATGPLQIIAMHALRYQDFERAITACQVFGEVKNIGTQSVISFTLSLELLDKDGRVVHKEDLRLRTRVIRPGNAIGDLRPLQPGEFGDVTAETSACPAQWLEGRIRYRLGPVTFGE